jgi:phage terminase large subunit-like protein
MTLVDGQPVRLLDSFKLWGEQLFGWYYFPEIKTYNQKLRRYEIVRVKKRLVNKQYLIVGRGAAKSMYDAFVQAYTLFIDTSTTHQIVTAPTMKLAEETMAPIRTALARSRGPLFKFLTAGSIKSNTWSKVKAASTKKGIENFITNSLIEVRPMRIDKLQGLRSKVNVVDEWLSGSIKEDVIGAIEQGASKVDDYTILATSSEGTARNGVGDTIKMELLDILNGDFFAPNYSIFYYRLDDVSEVNDPEMWVKANPNIGASVSYDAYQKDVALAEARPEKRNDILAKRFGIPVEGFTYFFVYEETLPHRKQNFDGLLCSMGADLSQGDDFCAFTFLFPLGGNRFGVKTRSYVSEAKIRKLPQAMRLKYDEFVKEGTLTIMDDPILDMIKVEEDVQNYVDKHGYQVLSFGYDPYNAREFTEKWSQENSEYGMEKVIQGARTESVPLGEIKNLAMERKLIFDEELMTFAMGNSVAIQDNNGNYKLSKLRSDEKIDNVAALMDSWVAYKRNQEAFL